VTAASVSVPPAADYVPHPLHSSESDWSETNCYVDVWIEVLHSLGLDPLAMLGCALSADFLGDQWSFLKPPPEDLRALWGFDISEFNVWRPVLDHVEEQLGWGRLLTVEVDSWWLPDAAATAYHTGHEKTTIVPRSVSRTDRVLGYFHGPSYFELSGADFDGIFGPLVLPPYVELIRLDALHPAVPAGLPLTLAREHLSRRPADNPVLRLGTRLLADLDWLRGAGTEGFHHYAFGVVRQCGATAHLAARFLEWLPGVEPEVGSAAAAASSSAFHEASRQAKSLQFSLARLSRGREVDPRPAVAAMAASWADAISAAVDAVGAR
jgi:hypothetical protein